MNNAPKTPPIKLYNETWRFNVHLLVSVTEKEIDDYLESEFQIVDLPKHGKWSGRCIEIGESDFVIAISENPDTGKIPTLVHECYHCVEMIMTKRGVLHGGNINETWAYLLEWMIEGFLYQINHRDEITPKPIHWHTKEDQDTGPAPSPSFDPSFCRLESRCWILLDRSIVRVGDGRWIIEEGTGVFVESNEDPRGFKDTTTCREGLPSEPGRLYLLHKTHSSCSKKAENDQQASLSVTDDQQPRIPKSEDDKDSR